MNDRTWIQYETVLLQDQFYTSGYKSLPSIFAKTKGCGVVKRNSTHSASDTGAITTAMERPRGDQLQIIKHEEGILLEHALKRPP